MFASQCQRNSKLFRALLHFLVLMFALAPAFAQVYKWVDERGVTHYGERPPQGSKASEVPNRLASPAPGGASSAGNSQPKGQDSGQSQMQSENTDDGQKYEAAKRQRQCNQQRDLLARLKQSPPSFILNEKGERIQADNSDAIARQEKLVAEQCKG